jgi:hypothetical protein
MARWTGAPAPALRSEIRARGERRHRLIGALLEETFAGQVDGRTRTVGVIISEWRRHDSQHAEDVRLALLIE